MTNPEDRNDAWKEALACYEDLADEIIIVGEDWPYEFKWDHIGKTFQEGFNKCNSDWVIRMDIDYFFHENDMTKIRKAIEKFKNFPTISFPQYQFFTPDRYQLKTRLCVAFNKRQYPNIKLNGGGDLTLATLNDKLIDPKKVPNVFIPIYQYESIFRTREIIEEDRARFSRAWFRHFSDYGDRGGDLPKEAFKSWFDMVKNRYPKHNFRIQMDKHPKYISEKLHTINENQFGYDAFGLQDSNKILFKNHLKGLREKYINHLLLKKYSIKSYYKG